MSDGFLSSEPVAYCWETPLDGWEIVSYSRAASEPELRWRKMIAITDEEREAVKEAEQFLIHMSAVEAEIEILGDIPPHDSAKRLVLAATLRGLLERLK